jgi:hypothetical protein
VNKEEFLQVFREMLVASFEMQAASEVFDDNGVMEAVLRLHRLGGMLSDEAMQVVVGVLISKWATYVAKDDEYMHPEEAIEAMITKLDRIIA